VTKDRRLGRGLAALLGTPIDENGSTQGVGQTTQANASMPTGLDSKYPDNAAARQDGLKSTNAPHTAATRNETIRQLNADAQSRVAQTRNGISPISIPVDPVSAEQLTNTTTESQLAQHRNRIDRCQSVSTSTAIQ
jgi:hypothetical protein